MKITKGERREKKNNKKRWKGKNGRAALTHMQNGILKRAGMTR